MIQRLGRGLSPRFLLAACLRDRVIVYPEVTIAPCWRKHGKPRPKESASPFQRRLGLVAQNPQVGHGFLDVAMLFGEFRKLAVGYALG